MRMKTGMIYEKLKELGLELPDIPVPVATYVPARLSGKNIYVSGQLPLKAGQLMMTGPVNSKLLIEAQSAMRQCFLNGLSAATTVVNLENISRIVRMGAFVASTPDFFEQHKVANGASDLAKELFGENGIHARSAIGVPSLPMGASVELEIIFEIE